MKKIIQFAKLSSLLLFISFYSGCVHKQVQTSVTSTKEIIKPKINTIEKLENLQQKPALYTNDIEPISKNLHNKFIKDYAKNYFYPWHISKFTMSYENATWGNMYSKRKVYSENLTPISKEWFDDIIAQSNFTKFNTKRKKAITINSSHIRVFPTISKIFYDPTQAGEGFPFDYNENSSIKINTPLFVSHLSKNKLWAYVESSVAIGWVLVKDIAYVDRKFIKVFENGKYYMSIQDDVNIYKNGHLLKSVTLGTLFPKAKQGFIIAAKNYKNQAFLRVIDANANIQKMGQKFNLENIQKISNVLVGQRYGWGGLVGNRDCSLMTKDFYAPFGIFLHRNSSMQKNNGKSLDVKHLNDEEKITFILQNALPFQTLIYLPGHIMIYVGTQNNNPLVFHNIWGIKTIDNENKEGREILGRAIVSTLNVGENFPNYAKNNSILSRIESLTMLMQ